MNKHIAYSQRRKHHEDFRVDYEFFTDKDGHYIQKPFQGMRCDFSYKGDNIEKDGIYMIHPEFENDQGEVITDLSQEIKAVGTAKMWVLVAEMRELVHCHKAKVGVEGYFMVGSKKIAKAKIIEIVDLNKNIS